MKKRNVWLGVGLALLVPAFVLASNLTVPNTFSAGTPIKSADVNANFAAVQTAVNSKLDATSAAYSSSARLAVLAYRTSDGATTLPGYLPSMFFDRTVGVNCAAALASDGKMRCLPLNGTYTYFYGDSACTGSLLTSPPPNPSGWPAQTTYLTLAFNSNADGGAWYDVHQPSSFSGTAYTYGQAADGGAYGCMVASPQPTGLFDQGPVVLPSSFMEFVPTTL